MSIYGAWVDAIITPNGGTTATVSAAADLGRDYHYMQIYIPTIVTGDVSFQVAETAASTYKTLGTGGAIIECGTGNLTTVVELGGFQFIKVVTAGTQTATTVTFRVRGSNV